MSVLTQWPLERYQNADAFKAFTATSDLDLDTARAMMWTAQLVYELGVLTSSRSVDKVKQALESWDMQFVQTVSVPGFQALPLLSLIARDALVISGRGALIVAFAGTDPARLQDWIVNFAAKPGASGVSRGLAEAAGAFAPLLEPIINANSDKKLFVTGHSLGGSLGVAVAYELSKSNRNAEAVYTFGMPRAGNAIFASDYDGRLGQRTFRFVHGDDLVPSAPPAHAIPPALPEHQHVGWYIHCDRGTKFARSQKSQDTKSNEPLRDHDIISGARDPTEWGGRIKSAWHALFNGDRPLDAVNELTPPRIRQHLQDQYIAALTP